MRDLTLTMADRTQSLQILNSSWREKSYATSKNFDKVPFVADVRIHSKALQCRMVVHFHDFSKF